MEILLQNGAEVNAANEVHCVDWRDMNEGNACQGGRNEVQECGMALAMAKCIESLSTDKVDEISWHQFAHPRIGDRMRLMINIV